MLPWSFAKKSVKIFLNFSIGHLLSQPLEDDQILLTSRGVGCKDIYFNTEKLSDILAESGIPLVVCVAYVAEVIVCLPWSIEINGVDLVFQALLGTCPQAGSDELFKSMISSMTMAAFAAAKAAIGPTKSKNNSKESWLHEEHDEEKVESMGSTKQASIPDQTYQFFENLTAVAENISLGDRDASSFVDQDSKERIARMIDSLIAQTTVILRDISIRIECQLGLPGLDRASGLTLSIRHLSISNQYKTEDKPAPTASTSGSGGRWSWLFWWQNSRDGCASDKPGTNSSSSANAGSISTMLHKLINLEELNLYWDLWDTSASVSLNHSSLVDDLGNPTDVGESINRGNNGIKTFGPTAERMVASAKLLTLPGNEHTARLSVRMSALNFNKPTTSKTTETVSSNSTDRLKSQEPLKSRNFTKSNNLNTSDFQFRLQFDLGPLIACLCPSEFYWIHMMIGQLIQIGQDYYVQPKVPESSNVGAVIHNFINTSRQVDSQYNTMNSPFNAEHDAHENSTFPGRRKLLSSNSCISESQLIDLDLSNSTNDRMSHHLIDPDSYGPSSPLLNSDLFCSCMTDNSPTTFREDNDEFDVAPGSYLWDQRDPSRNKCDLRYHKWETKFDISANLLCVALILFYEDESMLNVESRTRTPSKPSFSKDQRTSEVTRSLSIDHQDDANDGQSHSSPSPSSPSIPLDRWRAAELRGPSIFFSRFNGQVPFDPMNGCIPRGSKEQEDDSQARSAVDSEAMLIDRRLVDSGLLSPSDWISDLRKKFAKLASPRDHLCFIGGLWHFDVSNRIFLSKLPGVVPTDNITSSYSHHTSSIITKQLDFSAQLFGLQVSECLFIDSSDSRSQFVDLLYFPSNNVTPGIQEPAIKFNGSIRLNTLDATNFTTDANGNLYDTSINMYPNKKQSSRNTSDPRNVSQDIIHLAIAYFHLDVDVSVTDRLHRICDAIAASTEAIARLTSLHGPATNVDHNIWHETGQMSDTQSFSKLTRHCHQFNDNLNKLRHNQATLNLITPSNFTGSYSSLLQRLHVKLSSPGYKVFLRFPIPLEAVTIEPEQKLSTLRTKLWGSGIAIPVRSNDGNVSTSYLAWWKRTLRPEYLQLTFENFELIHRLNPNAAKVQPNDFPQAKRSAEFYSPNLSRHCNGTSIPGKFEFPLLNDEEEVDLSFGSISVHLMNSSGSIQTNPILLFTSKMDTFPEKICAAIRIAPLGRSELIECSDVNLMAEDFHDLTSTRFNNQQSGTCFEMGIDLTKFPDEIYPSRHSHLPQDFHNEYPQSHLSLEWSLWNQARPKQIYKTPFIIRKNFIQDAPKSHSKQTSYYPGNQAYMKSYRRAAVLHTRLFVHIKVPQAELVVDQRQIIDLLNLRLLYDLFLWRSLLPNDRRLRATVKRPTCCHQHLNSGSHNLSSQSSVCHGAAPAQSEDHHRYWFLSDPAPLASIYAHPDAARAAAELEASAPYGNSNYSFHQPSGLHFDPTESGDDDDDVSNENELGLHSATSDDLNEEELLMGVENQIPKRRFKKTTDFSYKTYYNDNEPILSRKYYPYGKFTRQQTGNKIYENFAQCAVSTTSVQHQSLNCIQLDLCNVKMKLFVSTTPCSRDLIQLTGSNVILFSEIGHNGDQNLSYFAGELQTFDVSFTASKSNTTVNSTRSDSPSTFSSTNRGDSNLLWPGLVHLSWGSINYPFGSNLCDVGSDRPLQEEPMLSFAVEFRQNPPSMIQDNLLSCMDEVIFALRLQEIGLIYWPSIEFMYSTTSALPYWLSKLCELFETSTFSNLVTCEYPAYEIPECVFIQHFHIDRFITIWSLTSLDLLQMSVNVTPDIRLLIGCESASITVNDSIESPSRSRVKGYNQLGMLIMTFLNNIGIFLFPAQQIFQEHEIIDPCSIPLSLNGFQQWLNHLDLNKAVCVASLDHLELRCFSEPLQTSTTVLNKPADRLDIRITNNLLRLHTCADTLVALQQIVELLTLSRPQNVVDNNNLTHHTSVKSTMKRASSTNSVITRVPLPYSGPTLSTTGLSDEHSSTASSTMNLMNDAISDTDFPNGSAPTDGKTMPLLNESLNPHLKQSTGSHPQLCRTSYNHQRRIHPSSSTSPGTNVRSCGGLYPNLSERESDPDLSGRSNTNFSSNSYDQLIDDFLFIDPLLVNQLKIRSPIEQVRVLIDPTNRDEFELKENFYSQPNSSVNLKNRKHVNRLNQLFTDPANIYPQFVFAVTLYDISFEWIIYGGTDLTGLTTPSINAPRTHRRIPSFSPNLKDKHVSEKSGQSAAPNPIHKSGYRFRHQSKEFGLKLSDDNAYHSKQIKLNESPKTVMAAINTRRNLFNKGGPNRQLDNNLTISVTKLYFRHANFPVQIKRKMPHSNNPTSMTSNSNKGHNLFNWYLDPVSRWVFKVRSVIIYDRIFNSNVNQLLYSYMPTNPSHIIPHNQDCPMVRSLIICWPVFTNQIEEALRSELEHLTNLKSELKQMSESLMTDASNTSSSHLNNTSSMETYNPQIGLTQLKNLEVEIKLSIQPLRINLDQNTLLFLYEFQQNFIKFSTDSVQSELASTGTVSTNNSNLTEANIGKYIRQPSSSHLHYPIQGQKYSPTCSKDINKSNHPELFIRKVTFYPDLPIRLDYHGRLLDLTGGSLHGLLATLLQLNNAELTIPRRVYQRGYQSLDRLVEEIVNDLRTTLTAQLPQLIATSLGPMHEVTQFLLGVWDLLYQPMYSICRGTEVPSLDPHGLSGLTARRLGLLRRPVSALEYHTSLSESNSSEHLVGREGVLQGLRRGTRSFTTSTLWATLQLSIQSVRAIQSVAETAYDLVTPGPALRSRQLRLRQPSDIREGFGNAMNVMTRGLQMVAEDLSGATRLPSEVEIGYKGPVGMVGDVLRQIPPTIVTPIVAGCEVTANILGGFRNQLRPEAKLEDEQKWKHTYGL